MNQFFSLIGQQLFRYIENNFAEFSTRLSASILSIVGSYFTADTRVQGFIRGLLLDDSKGTTAEQQYYQVVRAAVAALPEAMFLGLGGALVFWLLSRRVAVLPVEGPQLRRWSRGLFSVGLALTLGSLLQQLMEKAVTLDMLLQNGTRLAYAMGAFGCLAAAYVLTFVTAFYAFTSPNVRVIAAPWPLRQLFRGLARATMG
jgi:hypothetical protein